MQTLRAARGGGGMWWFVAIVGLGMLLSGLFVAAGGRGDEFDRTEELWGGLFFGSFGALALWVGYSNIRAGRPRGPREDLAGMRLELDREQPHRGEEVRVSVAAQGRLEVGLECIERYDCMVRAQTGSGGATNVRQVREVVAHEEWHPLEALAGGGASFPIPSQAPYSYEGEVVSYYWRVCLREVRARRRDRRNDHPLWVLP